MTDHEQPGATDSDPIGHLSESVRQRLAAAVDNAVVPFAETVDGDIPVPAPGQFWRARWNEVATTVLIAAPSKRDHVHAAAVTFDTDLAEHVARLATASVTTLGLDVVIWSADMVELPVAVLDRYLGAVKAPDNGRNTIQMFLSTQTVPGPDENLPGKHTSLRASLKDDLAVLARASWLTDSAPDAAVSLAGLKASHIADALNIALNEALQVKRGVRKLTLAQAQALADIAEPVADQSTGALRVQVPDVVVSLFNGPDVRARVVEFAARYHRDENEVREAAAHEIALNVAARATGDITDEDAERQMWRQRIQQYFEVRLDKDGQ